jgi:AcrR family transcriptional regulator
MGIAERKQLEKHARRQLILESAAEIFHQKDFARATMEDIAERAQIAVGTIYLYFKSKADIYFSLTKPALEKLSNRLMRIADDIDSETDVKIKKIMYMLDDFYIRNRDAYYLITHT